MMNLKRQREREINYVVILKHLIVQVILYLHVVVGQRQSKLTFFIIDLPVSGHGKGGRVNMNQQQAVIKSFAKDTTRDEDPREALLKYAELAENDPLWVNNVYKKTQPKPVFQEEEDEEEKK